MVVNTGSRGTKDAAKRRSRTAGTLAYLRRLRTYLWIGLVNPGPPSPLPRRSSRAA
jgi:hypothetical protein